ncbi:MAG TPA: protease inhibitor I42 family protein [Bryobacteraceae bacterium]|nr:protease inhibitor I42 family protein [Bryobacteraceae bacterium]
METLIRTRQDSGGSVELAVGDVLEIHLAETPTTGYLWKVHEIDPPALTFHGSRFVSGGPAPGRGGTRILTFEGVAPGRAVLRLKHYRQWAGDSSIIDRFELTVSVR